MRQIHDSLEVLSWEKEIGYSWVCQSTGQKNEIQKLDDKARQIPTRKEEQNFNTDGQQPRKKYEGLWKIISIIANF